MERVGILGGTFNPIHNGHLFLAQEALVALRLDKMLLVPNFAPPHRSDRVVAAHHRYLMVCLAASSRPDFIASPVELDRGQVSYSVDTVAALRDQYPLLTFVTGADALLRSPWKDLDRLLGMLEHFVVATRPGAELHELSRHLDTLQLQHRNVIRPLSMPALEISSTDIRRRLAEGRPISFLVPRLVEDYVRKHGLYQEPVA